MEEFERFKRLILQGNTLTGKCPDCKNPDVKIKESDIEVGELFFMKALETHFSTFADKVKEAVIEEILEEQEWMRGSESTDPMGVPVEEIEKIKANL